LITEIKSVKRKKVFSSLTKLDVIMGCSGMRMLYQRHRTKGKEGRYIMQKLLGGLVGAGKNSFIGFVHRTAAVLNGEAEIKAGVFSSSPDRCLERGIELGIEKSRIYTHYREMIEKENSLPPEARIDFVIIATPNALHGNMVKAFLEAGFHVISDKPMAISLSEALEIKASQEKSGMVFALTHGYAGYPMVKQARYLVKSGKIGKVISILVSYTQGWLSPLVNDPETFKTWHLDSAVSGPSCTMIDIGIHALNLLQTITGLKPEKVCVDLNSAIPGNQLDDNGTVLIKFNDMANGLLYASQVSTGEGNALRIRIYGDKASLSWDQEIPEVLDMMNSDGTSTLFKKGIPALCEEAQKASKLPPGHPEGFICAFSNVYSAAFRAIRCINNKQSFCSGGISGWDFPGIEEGIAGIAFVEAVLRNNKSSVKWTEVNL
jgi:predicted dehydrogenase